MRPVWIFVYSDCDIKLYLHFYITFNQIENCQEWQKCVTCHERQMSPESGCHQNNSHKQITTDYFIKLNFILDGKKYIPIHEALCATIWNIWYLLVTKINDAKNHNLWRIRTVSYRIKLSRSCPKDVNTFQNVSLWWHFILFRKSQV